MVQGIEEGPLLLFMRKNGPRWFKGLKKPSVVIYEALENLSWENGERGICGRVLEVCYGTPKKKSLVSLPHIRCYLLSALFLSFPFSLPPSLPLPSP